MLYQKSNQEYQHQKKRAYAKDIMSFPVRMISHDRTALEAKELLSKHGFRHLPVVNEQHIIVGLISDREVSASLLGKSCAEIMLSKVIVAEENASLNEIAILFLREKINALPIINHQRLLVGIITQTDILRYVVETTSLFGHA